MDNCWGLEADLREAEILVLASPGLSQLIVPGGRSAERIHCGVRLRASPSRRTEQRQDLRAAGEDVPDGLQAERAQELLRHLRKYGERISVTRTPSNIPRNDFQNPLVDVCGFESQCLLLIHHLWFHEVVRIFGLAILHAKNYQYPKAKTEFKGKVRISIWAYFRYLIQL